MNLYNVVLDRRRRRRSRRQRPQGQHSPKQNDDDDDDQIRMKRNIFQSRIFRRWKLLCGMKLSVLCLLLFFLLLYYKHSSSSLSTSASSSSSFTRNVGGGNHTTPMISSSSLLFSLSLSSLPSFEDGGFIFFLHIPKTGGTTIRTTLQDASSPPPPLSPPSSSSSSSFSSSSAHVGMLHNRLNYGFVSGRGGYDKNLPIIERYLKTNPNSHNDQKRKHKRIRRPILFLEIHGRDSPNLIELHDTLVHWKDVATQHNISTFFFTILRDPIYYALSYFNFFHLQRKNKNFVFIKDKPTEAKLLQYSLYNPQCQFLSRGEYSLRSNDTNHKYQPTLDECQHVYNILLKTMDYISITERMDYDILPILSHILNLKQQQQQQNGTSTIFAKQRVSIKNDTSTNSITLSELSPSTIATLEYNMSLYDRQLYNNIKQNYRASFS